MTTNKPLEALEKLEKGRASNSDITLIKRELKRLEIQDQILDDLKASHIEFVVEDNGGCYFKIKNTKGKERSYTSYSFLDFWRQVF